jgi:hypothetical protein
MNAMIPSNLGHRDPETAICEGGEEGGVVVMAGTFLTI